MKKEKKRKNKFNKWKEGRFKVLETKFWRLPLTSGHPKCMIHKVTHALSLPKFVFPSNCAILFHVFQKKKKQCLKNTFIICRVWLNAISSKMFYISIKMNEISSNKFVIFGKMFEFLCKMLKIVCKVFKKWCENSIIRRKNTEIYPKNS